MFTLPQLQLTMQVMGADRILYAVDYPYLMNDGAREFYFKGPDIPRGKGKNRPWERQAALKIVSRRRGGSMETQTEKKAMPKAGRLLPKGTTLTDTDMK